MNSKPDVERQLFFPRHTSVSYPQAALGHTHTEHSPDSRQSARIHMDRGPEQGKKKIIIKNHANTPHLPLPDSKFLFLLVSLVCVQTAKW